MTQKKKIELAQKAIEGKGVLIDPSGYIVRLSVTHNGTIRISKNKFIIDENSVIGTAVSTMDFKHTDTALGAFETLKRDGPYYWREDDRVLYTPESCATEDL